MKVLVVSRGCEKFVLQDVGIIRSLGHEVVLINGYFNALFFSGKYDLVISWFFSKHTIIPILSSKFFGRKIYCITGGHDTANLPEIKYGMRRFMLINQLMNFAFRFFDKIIVNSNFVVNELKLRGYINNEILVIHHFIEQPIVDNIDYHSRNKEIVYIGGVNESNLERKGLRFFLESSNILLDYSFICIGNIDANLISYLKNYPSVIFTGFISDKEINNRLMSASIILQPSLHEAFGLSVVEAMSFGVIPIISRNSCALLEVTGEYSFYIEDFNGINDIIRHLEISVASNYRKDMAEFVNLSFSRYRRINAFKKLLF